MHSHILAKSAAYSDTVNQIAAEAKTECVYSFSASYHSQSLPDEKEDRTYGTQKDGERGYFQDA